MKCRSSMTSRSGFTMIEVLVALLIITVAFTTVISIRQRSIEEAEISLKTRYCTALAEAKMGEVLMSKDIIEGFSDQGEFEGFPGYTWEVAPVALEVIQVSDTAEDSGDDIEPKKIYQIKLTVKPSDYGIETEFKGVELWATKLMEEDEFKSDSKDALQLNNFADPVPPGGIIPPQNPNDDGKPGWKDGDPGDNPPPPPQPPLPSEGGF